jgi:hypothetical protein
MQTRARYLLGTLLALLAVASPSSGQQTTTVTAQLNEFTSAGSGSRAAVYVTLTGCSSGPRVSGMGILRPPGPIPFSDTGLATFTLYRKTAIDCAGQNSSAYVITVKADGQTVWQKTCQFTTAAEDLSTTTSCTDSPPAPVAFFAKLIGPNVFSGTQDFSGATVLGIPEGFPITIQQDGVTVGVMSSASTLNFVGCTVDPVTGGFNITCAPAVGNDFVLNGTLISARAAGDDFKINGTVVSSGPNGIFTINGTVI